MGTNPTGTVTFLFTDVEGSTAWWEREPALTATALQRHDALIRAAIERHDGFVFSTGGDAFAASFSRAGAALSAAVEAQRALQSERWPEPVDIRVRMGVHTGEAQERDNDYFGSTVNRAARIMARARGGQILVSLATEELVRDQLASDIELVDLGEHRLASLQRPERVFQVMAPGVATAFPSLHDVEDDGRQGNVPRPGTSFVGRTTELKWLTVHLPERRLVTLTGPGGVGKSRLAIEAALATSDVYRDGVWLVDLAPATDPASVVSIAAATLDIRQHFGASLLDSVVDSLRGRRMLVIVDNCEHVLAGAADLIGAINAGCLRVTTLATSRAPLALSGEEVWPITPIDSEHDAVRLFDDRARAADARFEMVDEDVVAAICRRLDGMPLAIELAAARVRAMAPTDLLRRLDERFRLLRGGRDRVERHQTLRATIDWSYQLLSPDERILFDRISVMAPTFGVEDAEGICTDDDLAVDSVADRLAELVDQSMVVADRTRSGTRFRELETLRQYGSERLEFRGDLIRRRRRHLEHYRSVALDASKRFEGTANEQGANELEVAWNNIRTAVYFACGEGDLEAAEALLDATFQFAFFGLRHEQGDWAERVLQSGGSTPIVLGIAAYWRTVSSLDDALQLGRLGVTQAQDPEAHDTVYCWLAILCAALYSGRVDEAIVAARTSQRVCRASGSPFEFAQVLAGTTNIVATVDSDEALACALEAQRLAGVLRNRSLMAWATASLGVARSAMGDFESGTSSYREALEWAAYGSNRLIEVQVPLWLAVRSPPDERALAYADVLNRLFADRHWTDLWLAMESLAAHWADNGREEQAGVLLGRLDADGRGHTALARRRSRISAILRTSHPQSMARGAAMDREAIVQYALAELAGGTSAPLSKSPQTPAG